MTRILRYIVRTDSGMAPCVDAGLLSLATCKPRVRASAVPGDWVAGFRPSPAPPGLMVWAGRVARKLDVGCYERAHRGRRDAVYRQEADGRFTPLRPDYHADPAARRRDLAAPVLVFDADASWYVGAEARLLPPMLMHLAAAGRGHRTTGTRDGDAQALHEWLCGIGAPLLAETPRRAGQTGRCG